MVQGIQRSWSLGEPWEDTFPLRGNDGAYRWFLSRALPIRDASGKIVRWFGTNTDITERKLAEEEISRQAALLDRELETLSGVDRMRVGAYRNPPDLSGQGIVNSREWRAAEVPSTNGHGNARAVARLFAALAGDGEMDGAHILSPEMTEMALAEHVYAEDKVLGRPTRFGLGFQLTMPERRLGPGPRAFGHFGGSGSLPTSWLPIR